MFDDQQTPPSNLPLDPGADPDPASALPQPPQTTPVPAPQEPVAEPVSAAPIFQPPAVVPDGTMAGKPTPAPVMPAGVPVAPKMPRRRGGGFLKALIIIVLVLGVIAASAYLAYSFLVQSPQGNDNVGSLPDTELPDGKGETPEEPPSDNRDTDGDGLTDALEARYGTDPTKPDTDGDGLGDKEEVEFYATDPLNPDTDGDTFLDGVEVREGYNPNGPGRLFNVPQ